MNVAVVRTYVVLSLIAIVSAGCLGRLVADKGMSADRVECSALVQAVKARVEVADFRIPPGLSRLIGSKALDGPFPREDHWSEEEPQSIGCSTEVRGPFLTLYTVVG